jgi:serine O-acetyltransferase
MAPVSTVDAAPPTPPPGRRLRDEDLPPLNPGDRDLNPTGIGLLALLREDLRTHDNDPFEPGFWAVALHRFGNWRMGIRPGLLRAPFTLAYRFLARSAELFGGIHLPYTVRLGRRVRIWHHGGIVLHARSIGDDVHIRHNTTFGVAARGRVRAIPTIGDRVDIGCGACVLGDVTVGHDSLIGANAVVVTDIPPYATAVGIPARVIKVSPPEEPRP